MIPKQIFQTWSTKQLPPVLQEHVDRLRSLNPAYAYYLFDDADMDAFVNTNYPGPIAEAYNRLNIMVAKADFWRYLVLYKYGGIYIDMDSKLHRPLDDLIQKTDEAILSVERNPGNFVQWALIMRADHPILKTVIELVVQNIQQNIYLNDIGATTGPGAFARAIAVECSKGRFTLEWSSIHDNTNTTYGTPGNSFRVYKIDYGEFFSWCDYRVKEEMLKGRLTWGDEQRVRPLLKD